MDSVVTQQLPYKVDEHVVHRRWTVDLNHAAKSLGVDLARLTHEAREMAQHFPRWVLTVARGRNTVACGHCQGMLVFDAGLRCVQCSRAPFQLSPDVRLAWFGVMPPIGIDALPVVRERLAHRPPRQHVVGQRPGLGNYLLVPLVASYGPAFPSAPVDIFYLQDFAVLGPTESPSHAVHMLGAGRMCLFAGGEWYPQLTAREVLQQRAYPHVIKFLNHINGKTNAFAKVS